jgi:glycerol-3-phosphate dehydrogenase
LLNIFGGKITTYRRLADAAMDLVHSALGRRGADWTETATLPGGDFPIDGFDALCGGLQRDCAFLEPEHIRRLARAYGTQARVLLGGVKNAGGLGRHFGTNLYEAEVRFLMQAEWARTADDVLWRRSKLGLRLSKDEAAALDSWMKEAPQTQSLPAARGKNGPILVPQSEGERHA